MTSPNRLQLTARVVCVAFLIAALWIRVVAPALGMDGLGGWAGVVIVTTIAALASVPATGGSTSGIRAASGLPARRDPLSSAGRARNRGREAGRSLARLAGGESWSEIGGDLSAALALSGEFFEDRDREAAAHHDATHDPLTGLPNRFHCRDRLEQALARAKRGGKRVAVYILDLDGFAEINDRLGHDAGDEVLRTVAARLSSRVRAGDTAARIGGDDFIVFLCDAPEQKHLEALGRKLIDALMERIDVEGGGQVHVGAGIGIACYPDHAKDANSLLEVADQAMVRAKSEGRSRVAYAIPEDASSAHGRDPRRRL